MGQVVAQGPDGRRVALTVYSEIIVVYKNGDEERFEQVAISGQIPQPDGLLKLTRAIDLRVDILINWSMVQKVVALPSQIQTAG